MAVVYIPTRDRRDLLERVLKKWNEPEPTHEIYLVVERWEQGRYGKLAERFPNVEIMVLPRINKGINYARNWIVRDAYRRHLSQIIMADDDLYPRPNADVNRLFEWNNLNCLGIGIMMPYYGLMFGNHTMKEEDRPLMSKGALGKRLFSVNIERAIDINFDVRLHSGWGDDEWVRDGMAMEQATWYVHAGVNGVSVANRYTKGGLNSLHGGNLARRELGQKQSQQIIYKKWGPEYVSDPLGPMRFQWKKFLNKFVPYWEDRIDWVKE